MWQKDIQILILGHAPHERVIWSGYGMYSEGQRAWVLEENAGASHLLQSKGRTQNASSSLEYPLLCNDIISEACRNAWVQQA